MKLSSLIKTLQALEAQGFGDKQVFSRHSSSGEDCAVNSAHTSEIGREFGDFDTIEGELYPVISIGGN